MREQRILLTLDEATLRALEARVLALSDRVERLTQGLHDVELVEQDRRLRGWLVRGVAERLPPVQDGEPDALGLLFPDKSIELVQARFAPVLAPNQIGRRRSRSLTTIR